MPQGQPLGKLHAHQVEQRCPCHEKIEGSGQWNEAKRASECANDSTNQPV